MKKTIGNISHTLNLIYVANSVQGKEGGWEMEEVGSKLHLFGCQQKDLEKFHKVGSGWTLVMVITLLLPKCRQYSRVPDPGDHKVSSALLSQQNMKYHFRRFKFEIDNCVMKPYWHLRSLKSHEGSHTRPQPSFLKVPYWELSPRSTKNLSENRSLSTKMR